MADPGTDFFLETLGEECTRRSCCIFLRTSYSLHAAGTGFAESPGNAIMLNTQRYQNFEEPYALDALEEEDAKKFWFTLEALNPYCYFSYGLSDGFTFVARA